MHLNELAKLLKITGDESRLKILCVIFDKNKICVSDIASDVNMSIATDYGQEEVFRLKKVG